MKRLLVRAHGPPSSIEVEDVPTPEPSPDQVRVAVKAVGLNHLDLWVRGGVEGHRFPLPLVPGSDIAGVVDTGPRKGERVALHPATSCMACPACMSGNDNRCSQYRIRGERQDGGCAEYVVCHTRDLLTLPEGLSFTDAAALPLAMLTAWQMLRLARARRGNRVLVLGGTSGVGSAAIQIAHIRGCTVAATAGTQAKRELCRKLGADTVIDHYQDFRWKADVVVEHVGAATWARSLQSLDWGGRLVTCGATTGHEVNIDLRALFFKQQKLIGSTMGTRDDMRQVWMAVHSGQLVPVVGAVFKMSAIHEAHEALEKGTVPGKAVLVQDL
jgi:NADPH:quinone reductase-like Zn-dependent oxidoreductase